MATAPNGASSGARRQGARGRGRESIGLGNGRQQGRHPEQSDRERDPRAIHQPRPQVASLHVRAEQKNRLGCVEAPVDADRMARRRDHAEESIRKALGEEAKRDFLARVGPIHTLEGLGVADARDAVDVRAELPAVEPVDALRRHQPALRLRGVGVGILAPRVVSCAFFHLRVASPAALRLDDAEKRRFRLFVCRSSA